MAGPSYNPTPQSTPPAPRGLRRRPSWTPPKGVAKARLREYVLTPETVATDLKATGEAVSRVAMTKNISLQEAAGQLRKVRAQIDVRDTILAQNRGKNKLTTVAALRNAGVAPALLKTARMEFVTPEGRFESSGLPGGETTVRRLSPSPVRAPSPTTLPATAGEALRRASSYRPPTPQQTPQRTPPTPARGTPTVTPARPGASAPTQRPQLRRFSAILSSQALSLGLLEIAEQMIPRGRAQHSVRQARKALRSLFS